MNQANYNWEQVFMRAPDGVSVSAIVVSFRTGPALFDCLYALLADPDVDEVVLVDNGNTDKTMEQVEALWQRVEKLRVVGDGTNLGFSAGVNLGAEHARGNRYLIINPDAVLRRGSVAALEDARGEIGEPALVGGWIYGADGVEQRGARRRTLTLRRAAATFLGLSRVPVLRRWFQSINRNDEPMPDGPVVMDAVSGALMYISSDGFERLKGFDAGYFLHVEDLDICRRARHEGGAVIFTPLAGAYHYGATSDAPSEVVEGHKGAGLRRYFQKYARNRTERWLGTVLGVVMSVLLVLRAKWRSRESD